MLFGSSSIDSLKVRIKKDNVKIYDKRIVENFIAYYPTLQHLDDDVQEVLGDDFRKAEPFTKIVNGITYRFFFKAFITQQKTAEEYLVLQVSAKMCKQSYFDGITLKNYKSIVDDINSFKVVGITYDDFLDGLVSDIDICINQLIDEKSLRTAFAFILHNPKPSKKPLLHHISKTHPQKGIINLGLDFNKREKATNTSPYCKIYHKGIELETKSNAFYTAYLAPLNRTFLNNIVRYEFTIKANKHKEYLRKEGLLTSELKTMHDLLLIDNNELTNIAKSGLKHYLEDNVRITKKEGLNPTETVLAYYIENLINLGFDEDKLLGFQYNIDDRFQKSKTKTRVKAIIDVVLHDSKELRGKLTQNHCANEFLQNLGYCSDEVPF